MLRAFGHCSSGKARSQKALEGHFCPHLSELESAISGMDVAGSTAAGMDGLRRLQPDAAPSFDMLAPRTSVACGVRGFRDLTASGKDLRQLEAKAICESGSRRKAA